MKFSRLCCGVVWDGQDAEETTRQMLRRAQELGVDFFAPWPGASERLLGDALSASIRRQRDRLTLVARGGLHYDDQGALILDSHPRHLRHGLDESLHALGTDNVDLFLLHGPDTRISGDDVAEALARFLDQGKARNVGVVGFDVASLEGLRRWVPITVVGATYDPWRRDAEEAVLPYCREHDIKMLAQVLAPQPDDALATLAKRRGLTVQQLGLAWTLGQPGVDAALVQLRSAAGVERSVRAAEVVLEPDELAKIGEDVASA